MEKNSFSVTGVDTTSLVRVYLDTTLDESLTIMYAQVKLPYVAGFTEYRLRIRTPEIHKTERGLVLDPTATPPPVHIDVSLNQPEMRPRAGLELVANLRLKAPADLSNPMDMQARLVWQRNFFANFNSALLLGNGLRLIEKNDPEAYPLAVAVRDRWMACITRGEQPMVYEVDLVVSGAQGTAADSHKEGPERPVVCLDW